MKYNYIVGIQCARNVAQNVSINTSLGSNVNPLQPPVLTSAVTSLITNNTATFTVNVDPKGKSTVVTFEWWNVLTPTTVNTVSGSTVLVAGNVVKAITGLPMYDNIA